MRAAARARVLRDAAAGRVLTFLRVKSFAACDFCFAKRARHLDLGTRPTRVSISPILLLIPRFLWRGLVRERSYPCACCYARPELEQLGARHHRPEWGICGARGHKSRRHAVLARLRTPPVILRGRRPREKPLEKKAQQQTSQKKEEGLLAGAGGHPRGARRQNQLGRVRWSTARRARGLARPPEGPRRGRLAGGGRVHGRQARPPRVRRRLPSLDLLVFLPLPIPSSV